MGLLFLLQIYRDFGIIRFMFTNPEARWDFSMALYLLTLLIIPAALFLFFKRMKIGWTLLTILLTYIVVSFVNLFILMFKLWGNSKFDNLLTETILIKDILTLAFLGGVLWIICKRNIRKIFNVDRKYMLTTIGITVILTSLLVYLMF